MKKNSREYEVFRKYEKKKKLAGIAIAPKFVPTIECLAELDTTRHNCCNNLLPFKS